MQGALDVEGEGERRRKYFDYEEIFERVVKGGSSRNRASGRREASLVKESRDGWGESKAGGAEMG